MRIVALATLFHERGKLLGAVLAVSAVVTLVLLQSGLYAGFRRSAAQVVRKTGGDVWVHAKGTRTFDDAQPIESAPSFDASCTEHVRRVVVDFAQQKRADDVPVGVQVIGADDLPGRPMPWSTEEGSSADVHDDRVAVDRLDAEELGVGKLGDGLTVNGRKLEVRAFTRDVRPFTLTPYVFTRPEKAAEILRLAPGTVTYYVVDTKSASCTDKLVATPPSGLAATRARAFAEATERRWVEDSGIGTMLRAGCILSLFVGTLVLAQTLHALVTGHRKELATLKALGATTTELVSFVAWQAAVLATGGGLLGTAVALAVAHGLAGSGIAVVLDATTLATGLGGALLVTALASAFAARPVLALDPTEVLA